MSNEPSGASIDTPSVLEEALAAVRDRQAKYGPPGRHFARTAAMVCGFDADLVQPRAAFESTGPKRAILDRFKASSALGRAESTRNSR